MISLPQSMMLLAAAVSAAGLVCAGVAAVAVGAVGVVGALIATAICLVSACLVLLIIRKLGSTPGSILAGTFLRLVLVSALAYGVYTVHGGLEQKSFVLSLGVTYLAALAAETWLVLGVKPVAFNLLFKSRVEA